MIRVSAAIVCASSLLATGVQAQQVQLPAACQSFLEAPDAEMKEMTAKLEGQMRDMHAKMQRMGDTQKGLHDAMMRMHGPMMDGMMAKDSDVAWICSMIPHHQAAIVMAEAGLKGSDNAESRKLAEETITSQRKEISRLESWLRKYAESESRNEVKRGTGK
jgi:uncharacterized protein (DUF305 family)